MYYIQWKFSKQYYKDSNQDRRRWVSLRDAKKFASALEAECHIANEKHWLDKVYYVFVHPLNFEHLCSLPI